MKDLNKFKNEINLSGQNVYVGHRYVPKISGEWDDSKSYEALSIVSYQGASYTSRQPVPVGVEITNEDFWVVTGNYNAQVEQYRNDVRNLENSMNTIKEDVKTEFETINADLNKRLEFVNYEMFGVNGDKKYYNYLTDKYYTDPNFTIEYTQDDGLLIMKAHEFANEHNLPVYNPKGEYLIKETRQIPVYTSVDLGDSVFHIDEKFTNFNGEVFVIKSRHEFFDLPITMNSVLTPFMKRGEKSISALSAYENHFAVVTDNTSKVGMRQGELSFAGRDKKEFFYIGAGGEIIGDIYWDFDNISNIKLVEVDNSTLNFEGGVFLINGELSNSGSEGNYKRSGIRVERSRTNLINQYVGFEKNKIDNATASQSSFYAFNNVFKVSINGGQMQPRIALDTSGTYGIGGDTIINLEINNLSANGGVNHWGIMGLNMVKNLTVRNSEINRVDVHFFALNVSIFNSEIGQGGIRLSGGGLLTVNDTTVDGFAFMAFREDFGGYWDGDITVNDCQLNVNVNHTTDIIVIAPTHASTLDYGHDIHLGRRITVDGFTVNYKKGQNDYAESRCIRFGSVNKTGERRVILPDFVSFKNVKVKGRAKGMRLMTLENPNKYKSNNIGKFTQPENHVGYIDVIPNIVFEFDNIQLAEEISQVQNENAHLVMKTPYTETLLDSYSVIPEIRLKNLKGLKLINQTTFNKTVIENCSIYTISNELNDVGRTKLIVKHSEFRPTTIFTNQQAYQLNRGDVSIFNSELYPFNDSGEIDLEKSLTHSGFMQLVGTNLRIFGYTQGVRLSKELVDTLKTKYPTKYQKVLTDLNVSSNLEREFYKAIALA